MHLCVAIPCLNEAETIGAVIDGIPSGLPGVTKRTILVIDDGSSDESAEVARRHGARVLAHGTNLGLGAAFRTALEYALSSQADLLVHIDGDGQFDPADIATLIAPITAGSADFVTASRFINPEFTPSMPRVKYFGNKVMSRLIGFLLGRRLYDVSCGFRAFSAEAMFHLNLTGDFTHSQETILDLAFKRLRIVEIPVHVKYIPGRKSRLVANVLTYALRTLRIIFRTYRDYYPLRFFNAIGLTFMVAGGLFVWRLFSHYMSTGQFYGEIWSGFVGGFLLAMGVFCVAVGMLIHLLARNRLGQERALYLLKKALHARVITDP